MYDLSIIVPVYNEAGNIKELIERINQSMQKAGINYQLIFVDDHSTDATSEEIKTFGKELPIIYTLKKGEKGKAFSVLEGVNLAKSKFIGMIDGDLQYPPELIPEMFVLAQTSGVCVANRKSPKTSFLRKIGSKINTLVFGKFLLGLDCDPQSGLKVFKKEIIDHLETKNITKWTLDMPLLTTALDLGYEISHVDMIFEERKQGQSKVNFTKASYEIAKQAVKLRFRKKKMYRILPNKENSMVGAGVIHKNKRFITHTTLHHKKSAMITLVPWQKTFLIASIIVFLVGIVFNAWLTAVIIIAVLTVIYFIDMCFNLFVLSKSIDSNSEISFSNEELKQINDKDLPIYSILCPLYKEAEVLPDLIKSINTLDWPKEKIDAILLLEENDKVTIEAAKNINLPSHIRILIVPDSQPKTKPKACNYGLSYAKGEYIVIYDAEDKPDPLQLKKSYLGFQVVGPKVFCLQSKLNYYNPHQNFLTRLFTAEYSLWFDLTLPGLQSLGTAIPLGGTSNHFRTEQLKELQGWDPFNVTEDCDLGIRLFREGYKTAIIDSTTYEEANSSVRNWIRQRSRWIKGYFQTWLVHTREPIKLLKENGIHALILQLIIGMRIVFILINPILWITTISYFVLHKYVGNAISSLYPLPVLYLGITTLILGNFIALYSYMIGLAKRNQWSLVKYVFLIPLYWVITSIAASMALLQLITNPHYWEKTKHGLNSPVNKEFKSFEKKGLLAGGVLIAATVGANFFNFLYNTYLGRTLDTSTFGTIGLIGGILYVTQILTSAVGRMVTYKSGFLSGKFNVIVKRYWLSLRKHIAIFSLIASILWLIACPLFAQIFHTTVLPFLLFTPVVPIGLIGAVDSGFLSGNLFFAVIGVTSFLTAFLKFVFAFIFVRLNYAFLVYASIPLAMFISFLLNWFVILRIKKDENEEKIGKEHFSFPKRFFATAILTNISSLAFLSLDVILAKVFLSSTNAGLYTLLSLTGQIIYFFGSLFAQFIVPLISKAEGIGRDSKKLFYRLFFATLVASLFAFVAIGVFGRITVPILFGSKANGILPYLFKYGLSMVFFTLALNIVSYHQLKKQYFFPILSVILAVGEFIGLSLFHSNLQNFVNVMFVMGFANFVVFGILHLVYKTLRSIVRNSKEFSGLFGKYNFEKNPNKLKVLIFNWRDTKHVWAGGAEVYLHEIAKRWVKEGKTVTIFCGNDGKSAKFETIEGINIIRRGGFYTVYFWAFVYYVTRLKGKFDIVIDSENGIPFFTPLYVKKPIITIIYHVHQDVFLKNLNFISSKLARFLEAGLMPTIYKDSKIVTISNSTKENIEKISMGNGEDIEIVFPGADLNHLKPGKKTTEPTILYLGRLKPYKSVDTVVKAMPKVLDKNPKAKLIIAGFGESRTSLENLVKELHLENAVEFAGQVTEELKAKLMASAWLFVQPSFVEGWGISVIEANAAGTPVVASNVPGLRDSVQNPHTGYLVEYGNPDAFAEKINLILGDEKLRKELSKNSVEWAKNFDWNKAADKWVNIINKFVTV